MTLVEVVLAAALAATTLTGIMIAASRCIAVMRVSRLHQDVRWTMSMGEAEFPLNPTNEVADMEVPAKTYPNGMIFERKAEEVDEEKEDGLIIVRSRVTWSRRDKESHEEVVRYVWQDLPKQP